MPLLPFRGSETIFPASYFSKEGVLAFAKDYLSDSCRYAVITKTVDKKYHEVSLRSHSNNLLLAALKTASWYTMIVPLVAVFITKLLENHKESHQYYIFEDAEGHDLYNFCNRVGLRTSYMSNKLNDFRFASTEELSALYKLNNRMFSDRYCSNNTLFIEACIMGDKDFISRLYNIGGNSLLTQRDQNGDTPFTRACYHNKHDLVEHLYGLGGKTLLGQKNSLNGKTVLVEAIYSKKSWQEITMLNEITNGELFGNISEVDLNNIQLKDPVIYNKLINHRDFKKNVNNSTSHQYADDIPENPKSSSQNVSQILKILFGDAPTPKNQEEYRHAIRKILAVNHPDKYPDDQKAKATEKFQLLMEAYTNLQKSDFWKNLPKQS